MNPSEKRADQIQVQKLKSKLFVMSIQDENGQIVKVLYNSDYSQLWLLGTTEAKSMNGFWSIHRYPDGLFVDGNYKVKVKNG